MVDNMNFVGRVAFYASIESTILWNLFEVQRLFSPKMVSTEWSRIYQNLEMATEETLLRCKM